MDNIELYAKIKELVKNEARQEATKVYNELGTKYNVAQVPTHSHNGVDSTPIPYKNIVQGDKYTAVIIEDATETASIGGVFNPTRISFNGFAADNADGSPATKRAIINGAIEFGTCYEYSDLTPPIIVTTSGPGKPFLQYCNSMYIDSSDLTKNRVFATAGAGSNSTAYFAYANDDAGTTFVRAQVTSFNNQLGILTISFTMGTNVKLAGTFTIS